MLGQDSQYERKIKEGKRKAGEWADKTRGYNAVWCVEAHRGFVSLWLALGGPFLNVSLDIPLLDPVKIEVVREYNSFHVYLRYGLPYYLYPGYLGRSC